MNFVSRSAKTAFATMFASAILATSALAGEKWNMPVSYSAKNYVISNYIAFAEKVNKRAGGALEIVVHPSGSLFKGNEIIRAVRSAQAPIGARGLALHANEEPIWGMELLPFLVGDVAEAWRLYEVTKPAIEKSMKKRGMKLLYSTVWPPQGLFTKGAINTPEDLKGFKIRSYNATTSDIAKLAGAIPTKMEVSELGQALSTNVVQGTFGSGSLGVSNRLWDYLDHYYLLNTAIPKSFVFVNLDAWNALDKATQDIIGKVAAEQEKAAWDAMLAQSKGYRATLAKNGIAVKEPSDALKAHFSKVGKQMSANWLKETGDEGQALMDAFSKK